MERSLARSVPNDPSALFVGKSHRPLVARTQGALKGTELRWQREPKKQIFAANRSFSQIHPFSWKLKHLEGADFRRKPQLFADNQRFSQIGLRHLRSVTFSSALRTLCSEAFKFWLVHLLIPVRQSYYYFYRISSMNPLFSPHLEIWGQ